MSPARRTAQATEQLRSSLLEHARTIISRDGPSALTMRRLAAEADAALGLPYKVFTDRRELIVELVQAELTRLTGAGQRLTEQAGTGTVGGNLAWFARAILDSPAVALTSEIMTDETLAADFAARAHDNTTSRGPGGFQAAIASYLTAEQQSGRVRLDVDTDAFGFLLAGAIHNLVVSGPAYPRPSRRQLDRHLDAAAAQLSP